MKKIRNIVDSIVKRPGSFLRGMAFICRGLIVNTIADLQQQNQPEA